MKYFPFRPFFRLLFWMCLLTGMGASRAEDIDLYSATAANAGKPNVLFVLDNAANFSASAAACTYVDGTSPSLNGTAGGIEQCALYNVVSNLPVNADGSGVVNIGLMAYNANNMRDIFNTSPSPGNVCGGSDGGCLMVPLMEMTAANKATFMAWVKSWRTTSGVGDGYIKANGEATAAVMQEAWAYYYGSTGLSGRSYAGVKPPSGCQRNFVLFIGNAFNTSGTPGDGGSTSPYSALAAAPGITSALLSPITIPAGSYGTSTFSCGSYSMPNHTDPSGLYADEWARYMYQGTDLYSSYDDKQGITTYTIGLLGTSCKPDFPALLTSMARYGGGKYYATSSYSEIATAIQNILNEVQAVNSVFTSASLPVSVNAQGTYLNQIFLGMFRPDASGAPRWLGNLKQYQFIVDPNSGTLQLGDSAGAPALSSAGTGFLATSAISFWTTKNTTVAPDSTGGFFVNNPQGDGGGYDSPDGQLVEKGGTAQQLRKELLTVNYTISPAAPRRLYTYCPSGSGCVAGLTDASNVFATTNSAITDALLNSSPSIAVSSITRSGTTATVTTGTSHGFVSGDSVTISGANQSEYNGRKDLINKINDTSFSFSVPEYPPTPATGSFSASVPSAPQVVSSITRSAGTAFVYLPGHGYSNGQSITISGAAQSQYNGTFVITWIDANNFSYPVTEGPVSPAGSGTATVGSTTVSIEAYNANPNPGVVRATGSTTVTVTTTVNHGFSTGNQVTISGVRDAGGNLVPEYNIGPVTLTRTGNKSFTYTISGTTPTSPATGTIYADGATSPKTISSLTRSGNIVTATSASHGFVNGETVNIGGTPGTNENGYVGTFTISGVTTNTFNYTVVTTPQTPATGTISVQKATGSDRTALINWVRGQDNFGDEASPGSGYTVRPSIHGDVLHSRPVVVNYGDSRGLVVFYGANDGVFRAVNGSQATAIGSVPAGGELWGLILPEFYTRLNRQRINTPELKFPSTTNPAAQAKDYFVDGSPGVYQRLKADGTIDKAYLYLTMRRGGRFIYALDVSDPTAPTVLWKVSSADSGFGELGQTWSRPRVAVIKGYANPVLIFGAGYDPAEDAEPPTADTMGRGLFILDAVTGARVWSATYTSGASACSGTTTQAACAVNGMNWAMPAEISFVDRDNDGYVERLYAVDVGGNVWRVDLEPGGCGSADAPCTPDRWQVTRFAALGCSSGACAAGTTPRKLFYPPNVVFIGVMGGATSYDAVLLGSGDREHPLITNGAYNVTNRFYMLKDFHTGKDATTTPLQATITESASTPDGLFDATTANYDGTRKGYFVTLGTGEKVVNASITVQGTTFFGTNQPSAPSSNSCSANLGIARGYALSPFTAVKSSSIYDGGGLPPSPVAGVVNIVVNGQSVQQSFCVGCGGASGGVGGDTKSGLGAVNPSKNIPKRPRRTYWYKR